MIYNLYMCRYMVCGFLFEVLFYFFDLVLEIYSFVGVRDGGMEFVFIGLLCGSVFGLIRLREGMDLFFVFVVK